MDRVLRKMMSVMRVLIGKSIEYECVKKIYEGMYMPMVTYACGSWGG